MPKAILNTQKWIEVIVVERQRTESIGVSSMTEKNLFISLAEKLQKQVINIDQGIFNCYNGDRKYEY